MGARLSDRDCLHIEQTPTQAMLGGARILMSDTHLYAQARQERSAHVNADHSGDISPSRHSRSDFTAKSSTLDQVSTLRPSPSWTSVTRARKPVFSNKPDPRHGPLVLMSLPSPVAQLQRRRAMECLPRSGSIVPRLTAVGAMWSRRSPHRVGSRNTCSMIPGG